MRVSQFVWASAALAISGCSCEDTIGRVDGKLVVDPESLDFGDVPVGAEKKLPLTLLNRGNFLLNVTGFEAAAPFIAPADTSTSLAPNRTAEVMVGFRAPAVGPQSGKLIISADDPAVPTVEVPLVGNGIEAAVLVDPLTVDFGEILWVRNTLMERRMVTVSNPGTDRFELTSVELTTDAGGAFTLNPMNVVKSYGPADSGTFEVTYLPNQMGAAEGAVVIRTTAPMGEMITVRLLGTGVGPEMDVCVQANGGNELCTARGDNPRVNFGPVAIGASSMGSIRVQNIGTRDLTAQGSVPMRSADFAFAPDPMAAGEMIIAPGQSRTFEVTYTANDYDFDSILVPFGSNAARNTTAVVRLEGVVTQADINIVPMSITTVVEGGANRDEISVGIHNCGTAPLSLGAISVRQVTGPVMNVFSLNNVPAPGTMLPPSTCPNGPAGAMFSVVFQSTTNGNYSAEITVNSSDPVNPAVIVDIQASKR